ncbi:AAA family ATPase [Thiothrix litoralis]|jgi:hypothetical protein|uniref:AAA family ATPase n=1 Tax=Thiothrix litoralis TaxID=2891210 RepID=A0ABX7WR19_9GAMM|nr:AAA family ATPase [Thiothrix litoralis]QTR46060.1 AAA family ATPase [Thiothrix litoralis]
MSIGCRSCSVNISRDYDFFFREYPRHIIIDEAQEAPELFRHLRGVIDAKRHEKGRFILTGSNYPELLQNASDSLAGRIAIVEIGTLKMNEVLRQPLPPFYRIFEQPLTSDTLDYLKNNQNAVTQNSLQSLSTSGQVVNLR